ncbi:MAG: response regulator [Eubacterium sp.]|nr:response regulator [Eubacterium sp.]MCM1343874.1 response regulator [Muribaculaceae bacterium]MCM1411294.1 response regulator [Lachnospiraceae bacterium]
MYKLLIVDDEPLVQVGIKSMLDWAELDIKVIGTAVNGQAALKIIYEQSPDIVITDVKMPVMSGLELIRKCREQCGDEYPYFIILTSYEDFHMVKEALTYQVTDYLVKMELTPASLTEAIERVLKRIQESANRNRSTESIVHPFYDKFFIRLINDLFESEEQFSLQSRDLNLDFHYDGYVCCYGEMTGYQADSLPMEKQLSLFSTSMQMLRELAGKYRPCFCLSLDTRHFALIFCYETGQGDDLPYGPELKEILASISKTLTKYYNVSFRCGIGSMVDAPLAICDSYQCSRQANLSTEEENPIAFFEECVKSLEAPHNPFNISLFKQDLTKAFEEYDAETLNRTLDDLCELFLSHPDHFVQVLDGACNILYLSISLLQDGERIVSEFFRDDPDGYRSIYKQTTVEQIVSWLNSFKRQMCQLFESHHKDYKNHIVTNVKKYINAHLKERLSLNEVAAVFGISPNYLSQLFGRYNDVGFSEYINTCKIAESKRLLAEGNLKVYEVAEMLGFESAFYFSKVFKKVEGVSPTEYLNNQFM